MGGGDNQLVKGVLKEGPGFNRPCSLTVVSQAYTCLLSVKQCHLHWSWTGQLWSSIPNASETFPFIVTPRQPLQFKFLNDIRAKSSYYITRLYKKDAFRSCSRHEQQVDWDELLPILWTTPKWAVNLRVFAAKHGAGVLISSSLANEAVDCCKH